MERDSWLHGALLDQPFSLYKSHNPNIIMQEESFLPKPNYYTFSLSSNFQSKGLLKTPPLSLLHSAPPPLLPLPASLPRRSFSCPPPAIQNGTRKPINHFSSQKKSAKSSTSTTNNNKNIPRKDEKIKPPKRYCKNLGPELPKNIVRVDNSVVITISPPPPSSLPLPTFSLRPKLACNAAAGTDAGATDDLRRLLRLQ